MATGRRAPSRPIHLLPNLGPKSAAMLSEVGIKTEADLREIGAAAAYRRVIHAFPRRQASLNLLWSLQGAIDGRPWHAIDESEKARLMVDAGL